MSLFKESYSPFTDDEMFPKNVFQINFQDLYLLENKNIDEGIFIEYKEELSPSVLDKIPKIITSFANENGGWLFIGINDERQITPIPERNFENDINNKLNSATSPIPHCIIRFLKDNPTNNVGVLVIWTPEGRKSPYFANGSAYNRVGSGSQPQSSSRDGFYLVKDRYYLDQLYKKSEKKQIKLQNFCKKDIAIRNPVRQEYIGIYRDLGICNIYIIPKYDLKLYKFDEIHDIIPSIIEESKITRSYSLDNVSISLNIEFKDYSFSLDSIIFRSSEKLDYFENTIAWELFLDGNAKFHIPIPYFELTDEILEVLKTNSINYDNSEIFRKFDFVDGKLFLFSIFGCLGGYVNTMKKFAPTFDEAVVVIELLNIQKSSLFFASKLYHDILRTRGLKFSERKDYVINEELHSTEIKKDDLLWFLQHLVNVSQSFGFSKEDSIMCIFGDSTNESSKTKDE